MHDSDKKRLHFVVTVKPLIVQILTKETRVLADKIYEVECRTSGSRPDAIITWWKANKQIKKKAQNVSSSFALYNKSQLHTVKKKIEVILKLLLLKRDNLKL